MDAKVAILYQETIVSDENGLNLAPRHSPASAYREVSDAVFVEVRKWTESERRVDVVTEARVKVDGETVIDKIDVEHKTWKTGDQVFIREGIALFDTLLDSHPTLARVAEQLPRLD